MTAIGAPPEFIQRGVGPLVPSMHVKLVGESSSRLTDRNLSHHPLRTPASDKVPCAFVFSHACTDYPDAGYLGSNTPPQGEIYVRGNSVMKGYYKRPELDKEVRPLLSFSPVRCAGAEPSPFTSCACPQSFTEDGWLKTGDVGQWEIDGTLTIIDRVRNLIKLSSGEVGTVCRPPILIVPELTRVPASFLASTSLSSRSRRPTSTATSFRTSASSHRASATDPSGSRPCMSPTSDTSSPTYLEDPSPVSTPLRRPSTRSSTTGSSSLPCSLRRSESARERDSRARISSAG